MRLDNVRVELRPRSAWEAVDLGLALVRRHAAAIWRPWLLLTLPVFALFNAAAWALDAMWLAPLLMWWLLPLFDRVPLFVLSRAVFGDAPGVRQTLAAQRDWGWRPMRGYLTWRRLSPWRATTLPVDLLEGLSGPAARARRAVVGDGIQGHSILLTSCCHLFLVALVMSLVSLVLMFVPAELLSESAREMWILVSDDPPRWVQLLFNLAVWAAMSAVEPFFVGAGFGLYLNRRVRIEAWDIEIALRRMRARIGGAAALALVLGLALAPVPPAQAQSPQQDEPVLEESQAVAGELAGDAGPAQGPTLPQVFGEDAVVDHARFEQAVGRAFQDPQLGRTITRSGWERRNRDEEPDAPPADIGPFMEALAGIVALIGEYGLWLVVGGLVLMLVLTARRWWPWMWGGRRPPRQDSEIGQAPAPELAALPDDLVGEIRRLWREGRPRRALALLYRGGVEAMAARLGVELVPGATESECLRASRRLPDAGDRAAFARMVGVWQYAAYAQRLPDERAFEELLGDLARRFGWAA